MTPEPHGGEGQVYRTQRFVLQTSQTREACGVTSPFGRLTMIVNPRAGRRRVLAALPTLEGRLDELGLEHDLRLTEGPGDATRLARRALEAGTRFLVAVGGDGTVHEVVNGMLDHDRTLVADPVLGVVAAGSGCDLVRTFSLPQSLRPR